MRNHLWTLGRGTPRPALVESCAWDWLRSRELPGWGQDGGLKEGHMLWAHGLSAHWSRSIKTSYDFCSVSQRRHTLPGKKGLAPVCHHFMKQSSAIYDKFNDIFCLLILWTKRVTCMTKDIRNYQKEQWHRKDSSPPALPFSFHLLWFQLPMANRNWKI